jgi:hypothetical protein
LKGKPSTWVLTALSIYAILLDMKVDTVSKKVTIITVLEEPEEPQVPPMCGRCHIKPRVEGKGRCEVCLEYARNWQKNKTTERKQNQRCITCGDPTNGLSRCERCTDNKSAAYFAKKEAEALPA